MTVEDERDMDSGIDGSGRRDSATASDPGASMPLPFATPLADRQLCQPGVASIRLVRRGRNRLLGCFFGFPTFTRHEKFMLTRRSKNSKSTALAIYTFTRPSPPVPAFETRRRRTALPARSRTARPRDSSARSLASCCSPSPNRYTPASQTRCGFRCL